MPIDFWSDSLSEDIADLDKRIKWVANILSNQENSEAQANSDFNKGGQELLRWLRRQREDKVHLRDIHRRRNAETGIKY